MTYTTLAKVEARVDKGVALLDQVAPGWRSNVDESILWLEDISRCVLGQVYGDYYTGTAVLSSLVPDFRARDYGFDIGDDDYDEGIWFALLDEVWQDRFF